MAKQVHDELHNTSAQFILGLLCHTQEQTGQGCWHACLIPFKQQETKTPGGVPPSSLYITTLTKPLMMRGAHQAA